MKRNLSTSLLLLIGIVLISAGWNSVPAQKSRSRATKSAAAHSRTEPERIRARKGESLTSIAERAGVNPDELARLNNLSSQSKLRRGQYLLLPAADSSDQDASQSTGLPNGKLIKFADGSTLHVDDAWRQGEAVWFSRRGVTETTSRQVKSIEPVFVARVGSATPATPPPLAASETPAEAAVATWIYLVGGARFKVDEVNKTADGAWYQRGNLLSFLESARIDRIEREVPGTHQPGWNDQGWTSGSSTIDQLIRTNGSRFGVDPYLVFLVIEQESHFRTGALSPKGARGLMQLMPGTARRFGVRRPHDPVENIRAGTQYLKELLTMFNGRVDLALASYNAGEHRVISYGNKVPPFQETQNYVRRINQRYKRGSETKKGTGKAPSANGVHAGATEDRP